MGVLFEVKGGVRLSKLATVFIATKRTVHLHLAKPLFAVFPAKFNAAQMRAARISRVIFFAIVLITPQAQAQKIRVIRNDAGGNVNRYLMDASAASAFGQQIKIDGWCASACTLYLGSPYTCVTPRAKLAFHAPRGGSAQQNRHAAQVMAGKLPPVVGRWYMQNAAHLTGQNYQMLTAKQLVRMGGSKYC